ncbi:MAG: hypothetical protein K6G28_00105 [Acholeplasmatales bacterium]|nr:hypothetical protein [Acholeplasmatales bacterium]
MRYVVIPSAKYAPLKINNYGDVPMALYPINNDPILKLILAQYDKKDKIVVVGYEGFERLDKYIKTINDYDIKSEKLDELSSLSYSLKSAIGKIDFKDNDELIINFADTVVDNNDFFGDSIVCKNVNKVESKWSYFVLNSGKIERVIDKKEERKEGEYKLICGVFSFSKPAYFARLLDTNSLFDAIIEYSKTIPFKFVEAINWLDIGHPDEYFDSKIAIKSREFNHMSFDKNRGILRKTSDDTKKFAGEIEWYIKLPKSLKYVVPRIFDYSLDYNDLFVEMEFYSYPTLLELSLYGNLNEEDWKKIFTKLKFVLDDFKNYTVKNEKIKESIYDMYFVKTIDRLNKLRDSQKFAAFFAKPIIINGVKYKNLSDICNMLEKIVNDNLMNVDSFNIIHGDLCFANILIDDKLNFIKLIDPRGKFGFFDLYGDSRYELAKLMHSVDGKYDYIIKDLFNIKVNDNEILLSFELNKIDIYKILIDSFDEETRTRRKEIEIIESLLFLSMIPLHNENINHQYAMLAVGLQILDRWIDIKEK